MYIVIDPLHLTKADSNPQIIDLCGVRLWQCVSLPNWRLPSGKAVVWVNPDQGGTVLDLSNMTATLKEIKGSVYKNKADLLDAEKWLAGKDKVTDPETKETYEVPRFIGVAGEK